MVDVQGHVQMQYLHYTLLAIEALIGPKGKTQQNKYAISRPCSGQGICRQRCQLHTTDLPKTVPLVKVLATIEQAGFKVNTDVQGHVKMSSVGIQFPLIHRCFPDTTGCGHLPQKCTCENIGI